MTERIKIWAHKHERNDKFIVFVNGHALYESSFSTGAELARAAKQQYLPLTTFPVDGRPIKTDEEI